MTYAYGGNNNKLSQTVTRTINGNPRTITTNYKYDTAISPELRLAMNGPPAQ